MHEFPEVQAMIREALTQVAPGCRIKGLKIIVGEASGHDPHHIHAHFADAARGTLAEGATLEFISEKLAARCVNCGATFDSGSSALSCIRCGGTELAISAGKTVRLAAVVI